MKSLSSINALLAALLAVFYVLWWWSVGASTRALPLTAMFAAVIPLLLLLPALGRSNRFGTTLAGLLTPFHLAWAVMELVANPDVRAWVAAQTFLTLLLMVGVMSNLRQMHAGRA